MNISDRINIRMKALGIKGVDITKATGVSSGGVSQWRNDITKPTGKNLFELASLLKCSPSWLLTGKEEKFTFFAEGQTERQAIEEVLIRTVKFVPVISWVRAGNWQADDSQESPDEFTEFYPCPESHSESTFALRIIGESMSPDFIEGEIIFVDPTVEPKSSSCVVVRQNSSSEATFKQLIIDPDGKRLKALNPDWSPKYTELMDDAVICGVVIGSYRKR